MAALRPYLALAHFQIISYNQYHFEILYREFLSENLILDFPFCMFDERVSIIALVTSFIFPFIFLWFFRKWLFDILYGKYDSMIDSYSDGIYFLTKLIKSPMITPNITKSKASINIYS